MSPFGVWPECTYCGSHDWTLIQAGRPDPVEHTSVVACAGCGERYAVNVRMAPVRRRQRAPAGLTTRNGKDPN